MENFRRLNETPSTKELNEFLFTNFHKAGHELKIVMPSDFKSNISLFDSLKDPRLREYAYQIHSKWKSLLRQVDKSLLCDGCESTLLDLPYPFLVPGGRFREYYYWDTFWILEGIYVSNMCSTAKSVIENTLWMAKRYGFVPNGSRTYYLNRSQPPMLPMMVDRYLEECGKDLKKPEAFLKRAIEALEREYGFWMDRRAVRLRDCEGREHVLNRYSADMAAPRPESYLHDVKLAEPLSAESSKALFHNIAATTESGWDFSGRWMNWSNTGGEGRDEFPGLDQSITSQILPVDLNAVLFRNELVISRIYGKLGDKAQEGKYAKLAEARAEAIEALLFSKELNMWKDFNYVTNKQTTDRPFYITDICPLWYGPYKNLTHDQIAGMLESNKKILYEYPGGIPISESYTGQQWDFPNVWAPTQFLAVKLHLRLHKETSDERHFKTAVEIAQKWVTTTYCGHRHYGYVFEKYNAKVVGQPGGGGEYIVQEGFGWSNGVILWMLKELGPHLTVPERCPNLPVTALRLLEKHGEGGPYYLLDVLSIFAWIMTLLLSSTFLVFLFLRYYYPPGPADNHNEALLV